MGAELFSEHGLPGVELEEGQDLGFVGVGVDEAEAVGVPADVLERDTAGLQAGLVGGVADVGDGEVVFGGVFILIRKLQSGEVDRLLQVALHVLPLGDKAVVDGVELVRFVEDAGAGQLALAVLEPGPLDDGGLEQRGGGVGVVLEQLGRLTARGAGPADVEASVEGRGLGVPGGLDGGDGLGRDGELGVALAVDDGLGGGEAHLLELVGGGFERVDLGGGELVGGGLIPVGLGSHGGGGVEGEAGLLDGLLPVGAGGEGDSDHFAAPG